MEITSKMATSAGSLCGKVALITGASSGIGAATAIHFSKLGAKLSLTGRNEANLLKTLHKCVGETYYVVGDLTDEDHVVKLVDSTVNKYGRLDILVNNAGVVEYGTIETTSLEQFDRIMNTNIRSVYHLTMLAVPHLIQAKGAIVNVSSLSGIRSLPDELAYALSKSALDQFTRCVALELAPKQVRVNSVNPGVIITEIQKRGGLSEEEYDKLLEKSKTTHAMGRPGEVDEVAKAIAFLASDDASFITGALLPVDGGRQVMCPR